MSVINLIPASVTSSFPPVTTINGVEIAKEVFRERMTTWELVEMDGEFVFESDCGEDTVKPSQNPEEFNNICESILEQDADHKGDVYPPVPEGCHALKLLDELANIITVNHLSISPEVFEKRLTEWMPMDRQEFAEWVQHEGDEEAAYKFFNLKDAVVLISRKFDGTYLTASETPEAWNKACEEIIEADKNL